MTDRPPLHAVPDLPDVLDPRSRPPRPDLRRPPPAEPGSYVVRAELDHSTPTIWRTLQLRSDQSLARVHRVLQAAFGWTDSHLHRFALGGHPFDLGSQLFLCPFDVEEGEDDGLPAERVRLDEVLGEPGDVVAYLYDYGDSWELTLTLEEVRPTDGTAPAAALVDGERAAPPEDSGGGVDETEIATFVADPAYVDLDAIRATLASPYLTIHELGLRPDLVSVVLPLGHDHPELLTMAAGVADAAHDEPSQATKRSALAPFTAFLDQAADAGIKLTAAGYLPPAVVAAVRPHVPGMRDWIGVSNVEIDARPVLFLREAIQRAGLLRKHRGHLVLTRAGAAGRQDVEALWRHLAAKLVPGKPFEFDHDAMLLTLLHAGAAADGAEVPVDRIADCLTALGYGHGPRGARSPVDVGNVLDVPMNDVLLAVDDPTDEVARHRRPRWCGPVAAALARAALTTAPPAVHG